MSDVLQLAERYSVDSAVGDGYGGEDSNEFVILVVRDGGSFRKAFKRRMVRRNRFVDELEPDVFD